MDGHTGIEGLVWDLELQRAGVGARVPVYDRLFAHAAALLDGDAGRRLAEVWRDRRFFVFYDRPLLIAAALRFDAMATGDAHPLWDAIVADPPRLEAATLDALQASMAPERERFWRAVAERVVQTNETSRSVVWRWPARLAADRPIALVDLGCSAGLNLVAGELPAFWTSSGAPLDVAGGDRVVSRTGIDARPLDVRDHDAASWLRAAVWPGDRERLARLDVAIAAMRAARDVELHQASLERAPAICAEVSARAPEDALILAYQTVVREYLSPEVRTAYDDGMRAWLGDLPPGRAVWLELEIARGGASDGARPAAIDAHLSDGRTLRLARTDYHPRDLLVDEAAASELQALIRRG